mmetsp:Transcript_23731/g.34799  ORF Transcript_23731/g.34799 Transcript_23731/m.34799 type:complete len:280 (+) Transcript_23731:198-1037(+)|eukprot:CAMPEP_0185027604 /NCGR_PEP_ID=MMETSP1103-20130426/12872_1 /TAXON_ID=36769 /ORGANISM="Paraphysomonas bandaiensis, Strain Caron Lab Isolate" /LENGTH=279 /DNA_ID=CAMNT_0027561697 /DNA_START=161 /DNA_END=1000 /DNA_ORIENTATION=-
MANNERGLQNKASDTSRQFWEGGEFPMLCESCLGDNPYLRMQKQTFGGNCKMCDRPFTIFRWRPGRGEGYRKTEVCQTCSKIKNLCQTCILDLQFGLPSQLRDAVLSQTDGTLVVPESDANREYFAQQHNQQLAAGNDPWQSGETPNEKLLKIVRSIGEDRDVGSRVKLSVVAGKRHHDDVNNYARTAEGGDESRENNPTERQQSDSSANDTDIMPPPGMTIEDVKKLGLPSSSSASSSSSGKPKPKPPKPAGPPPEWAFKQKKQKTGDVKTDVVPENA